MRYTVIYLHTQSFINFHFIFLWHFVYFCYKGYDFSFKAFCNKDVLCTIHVWCELYPPYFITLLNKLYKNMRHTNSRSKLDYIFIKQDNRRGYTIFFYTFCMGIDINTQVFSHTKLNVPAKCHLERIYIMQYSYHYAICWMSRMCVHSLGSCSSWIQLAWDSGHKRWTLCIMWNQ